MQGQQVLLFTSEKLAAVLLFLMKGLSLFTVGKYLEKQIPKLQLRGTIDDAVMMFTTQKKREESTTNKMKILYVEDNLANLALVERIAVMGSHDVVNATSAEAALQSLHQEPPDLLLVDIRLDGELDGIDFISSVRRQGIRIPVIVITAYDVGGQRERCFAAGCDEYYPKPINVKELQRVFERYIV